ncbi:MAG: hypothetical protein JWN03_8112, partial [Nocardia sp.]|nr:hypothetical protein [Nocardia sp.]
DSISTLMPLTALIESATEKSVALLLQVRWGELIQC